MAEETVLKRYATEFGPKGQCQKWKITAIANDRKNGRLETSVLELFVDDVEREVDRILDVKPIIQELCPKEACDPPDVVEKRPAGPINEGLTDDSSDVNCN